MRYRILTLLLLAVFSPAVFGQTGEKVKTEAAGSQDKKRPLFAQLSSLDPKSAKELFGKRLAARYFIVKVVLRANRENEELKDGSNGVMIFGDSVTAGVAFEKRLVKPRNKADREWREAPASELWGPVSTAGCGTVSSYRPVTYDFLTHLKVNDKIRKNLYTLAFSPIEMVLVDDPGFIKYMFLPRQPIRGAVPDQEVRIKEVCGSYFEIGIVISRVTNVTRGSGYR